MKFFGTIELDTLSPYKTICPFCKNEIKLTHLQFSDIDDNMIQKLDTQNWKQTPRYMKKDQYDMFASKLEPFYEGQRESNFIATIARIESHKIGLFKAQCKLSNRLFRVYHHVILSHKDQTAGATSSLGEEVEESTLGSRK